MAPEGSLTPPPGEFFIGGQVPDAGKSPAPVRATPPDERRAIRKFALRVLMFCSPVFLFLLGIEVLLWCAGETWPLERVIRHQDSHPRAFFSRLLIDQGTFRYKYLQILRRHPDILVLGSSRMMQFRAQMFGRQAPSFYNAAGLTHSVEDLHLLFDQLPSDATPKVLIVGIDFWWLNPNEKRAANDAFVTGAGEDGTYRWQGHATALSNYLRRPESLGELIRYSIGKWHDRDAIGLQALLHRQGFRPDGSKRFDLKIPTSPEGWRRRLPSTETVEKDILARGSHFAFTDGSSPELLMQLRLALQKIKARGVLVIGYNPPVIAEWARVVSTVPEQKKHWDEYHQKLAQIFRELDMPFFDVITPAQIGLDDRYMRDSYHAHEPFDLAVLRHFCEDPEVRATMPDVPQVAESALGSPRTNPLFLDLPGSDEQPAESAARRRKRGTHKTKRDPTEVKTPRR